MSGEAKQVLEAAGVVIIGPSPDDPLFLDVTFPPGWHKKATDHSMWSELRNEKNEIIAHIFYKAAFYDRSAFLRIENSK